MSCTEVRLCFTRWSDCRVQPFKGDIFVLLQLLLLLLLLLLFTAIGLSPGGSGYFTCIQNMELVTNKFKSGELHEKHVVARTQCLPRGKGCAPRLY